MYHTANYILRELFHICWKDVTFHFQKKYADFS